VQVYQLTVVAQDRGPDAMPTDAAVVVRIIDVNDCPPTISVNTLASRGGVGTAVAEVPENLPRGTFVAHVTVADADSGKFGRVDCNITDADFALQRRPDSNEFQVVPPSVHCPRHSPAQLSYGAGTGPRAPAQLPSV